MGLEKTLILFKNFPVSRLLKKLATRMQSLIEDNQNNCKILLFEKIIKIMSAFVCKWSIKFVHKLDVMCVLERYLCFLENDQV